MILERVEVRHWGPLERLSVQLDEGANLLAGPNGSGKSSLVDAVGRGLFDRHDTRAAELARQQPWGTRLGPWVRLQVCGKGQALRITKRFLVEPLSLLERRRDGDWAPLAEGKAADRAVLEWLEASGSRSGASRAQDRGVAQLLWALQGRPELPDVVSTEVRHAVRECAGQLLECPATRAVVRRLEQRYGETFTAAGKLRRNTPLRRLELERQARSARRDQLAEQLHELERGARTLAELRVALAQAEQQRAQLAERRVSVAAVAARLSEDRQRLREAVLSHEAEAGRWRGLADHLERLDEALGRRRQVEQELASIEERLAQLTATEQQADRELAELAARREALRRAWRGASERRELLGQAAARQRASTRVASLRDRLDRAVELEQWLAGRQHELGLLHAPTVAQLTALESAVAAVERAEQALDAAAVRVRVIAERPLELGLEDSAGRRDASLASGESTELIVTGETTLELPGVGRVELAPGPGADLDVLRRGKDDARQRLRDLLVPWRDTEGEDAGHAELLDTLSVRARRAEQLLADRERLAAELRGLAPAGVERLEAELAEAMVGLGVASAGRVPAPGPGELEAATRDAREAEAAFDAAEQQQAAAQTSREALARERGALAETMAARRGLLAHLGETLDRLTADGLELVERRDRLAAAERRLAAREAERAELAARVEAAEQTEGLAQLDRRIDDLARRLEALRQEVAGLEGAQVERQRRAPAEALAGLDAELADLARRIEREQRRADGLALLHDSYRRARQESLDQAIGPIGDQVVADLAALGQPVHQLALGDGMQPHRLAVEPGVGIVPDQLSRGIWSLLVALIRLNLGELLSAGERQLVILDDTLVHTDDERLSRLLPRLARAAERVQLLLVTCHPDRYAQLEARRIGLPPSTVEADEAEARPRRVRR